VHPAQALLWIEGECDEDVRVDAIRTFSVGDERSFDQDPRFGLSVLAEIASRALSPAVNDPGTAIDVIGRAVRIFSMWTRPPADAPPVPVRHPRVHLQAIRIDDLFDDIFSPIARDGAGIIEVQARLQKALLALCQIDAERFGQSAVRQSERAWLLAEDRLVLEADKDLLRDLVKRVESEAKRLKAPV
jgi:uncharacterized membrane protein